LTRVDCVLPRVANAWLLTDGEGRRFLIDTGYVLERPALALSLKRAGVGRGDLTAVLLTHRHSDHAGNAAWLRDEYRAPVICHHADAVTLQGEDARPRLAGRGYDPFHDTLCRIEDAFPAKTPVDEVYDEGDWRWGFRVIHVGGHTRGSSLLLHQPSGTLFTGDALLSGLPVQRFHTRLMLAVAVFSEDVEACHRATLSFLGEEPPVKALCSGHGPKVTRSLGDRLAKLRAEHARPSAKAS